MAVRQLRDLLRGENLIDRVAPRASDLAVDLGIREQAIAQQLPGSAVGGKTIMRFGG